MVYDCGELLHEYKAGNLQIEDAYLRIDRIEDAPLPWGKFAILPGYAFFGAGLAPLLGGGRQNTLFETWFSILVYGVVLVSGRLGVAAMNFKEDRYQVLVKSTSKAIVQQRLRRIKRFRQSTPCVLKTKLVWLSIHNIHLTI